MPSHQFHLVNQFVSRLTCSRILLLVLARLWLPPLLSPGPSPSPLPPLPLLLLPSPPPLSWRVVVAEGGRREEEEEEEEEDKEEGCLHWRG